MVTEAEAADMGAAVAVDMEIEMVAEDMEAEVVVMVVVEEGAEATVEVAEVDTEEVAVEAIDHELFSSYTIN